MSKQPRSQFLGPEQREAAWARLGKDDFDVIVIGGGVVGAGIALDAATRGLEVALVEARELASGTSSRRPHHRGPRQRRHQCHRRLDRRTPVPRPSTRPLPRPSLQGRPHRRPPRPHSQRHLPHPPHRKVGPLRHRLEHRPWDHRHHRHRLEPRPGPPRRHQVRHRLPVETRQQGPCHPLTHADITGVYAGLRPCWQAKATKLQALP